MTIEAWMAVLEWLGALGIVLLKIVAFAIAWGLTIVPYALMYSHTEKERTQPLPILASLAILFVPLLAILITLVWIYSIAFDAFITRLLKTRYVKRKAQLGEYRTNKRLDTPEDAWI